MTSTGCSSSSPFMQTKPLITSITKSAMFVFKGHENDKEWKCDDKVAGSPVNAIRPGIWDMDINHFCYKDKRQ